MLRVEITGHEAEKWFASPQSKLQQLPPSAKREAGGLTCHLSSTSLHLTCNFSPSRMFSGLMSRWTMPLECRSSRPRAMPRRMSMRVSREASFSATGSEEGHV